MEPKEFFVMLNTQNGSFTHMTNEEGDDIEKFSSKEDAIACAKNNMLAKAFGFTVFNICDGD